MDRIKVEVFNKTQMMRSVKAGGEEWVLNPRTRSTIYAYMNELQDLQRNINITVRRK